MRSSNPITRRSLAALLAGAAGLCRTARPAPMPAPAWPDPARDGLFSAPADASRSVTLRNPRVTLARAESSLPLRDLPQSGAPAETLEHEVMPNPLLGQNPFSSASPDPVLQNSLPICSMPVTLQNFIGMGRTASQSIITGTPPDSNGAVGPNHYVQAVNGGIEVWNKSGAVVAAARFVSLLWTGYVGTNPGNGCATRNDGDPVVLYDQMADRWFITQYSVPNTTSSAGPSFQCVAVSQTGDPAGAYWLYDFRYNAAVNDYAKFGVWPDGYYATFNLFSTSAYLGDEVCAYDRARMLQGQLATQQCFLLPPAVFGLLPASLDGRVNPPAGEPAFMLGLGTNALNLYKFSVDWTIPANSAITGPVTLPVAAFTLACNGFTRFACVPQLGTTQKVSAFSDRLMFRLSYRNFGTHEALFANHAVAANSASGVRWYEIRSPAGTPAVFQQGTYAPVDGNWRWLGSLAQDQARDITLGFSISGATLNPGVGWTGRIASDPMGTMGQAEAVIVNGAGHETGADRWGDYSDMTVDPVDDCTFWFTTEYYDTNGSTTWDTRIASVKFPNCAANDFSIGVSPASQNVPQGGQAGYTVTTALTFGSAESLALNVQDLPSGVSGSFAPPSVMAGQTSTLTLTATAGAPVTAPVTFTVIGTAPSAVHPATAQAGVTASSPPVVTSQPSNQLVCAGTTASFSAAASGAPAPAIQWQVSSDGGTIYSDIPGATASPYSFAAGASQNGYKYRAVFTNSGGSATSQAATLTVLAAPPSVGNTERETHSGPNMTFTWTDQPGATDYIVYQSATSSGPFSTQTGTALTGTTGLSVPAPPGSWYFEVAGENACGVGPF